MAGYSGTPLSKKLGIKEDIVMYIFKNPPDYFDWLSPLPPDIKVMNTLKSEVDFIHSFLTESKVFKTEFVKYKST